MPPTTDFRAEVILLAAGMSVRMGERNKLLIEFEGEALVRRTARIFLAAGGHVHVVLGHDANAVRHALRDLPLNFIENPHFAEGQSTSVRAGLEGLTGDYDAVVIALSDQASLTVSCVSDLLSAFKTGDRNLALIPYYGNARGNPVVFPASMIVELKAAGLNVTCREFLDRNPHRTRRYEAPNDHFVLDIDTPADLTSFENSLLSSQSRVRALL